jgi:hypothetical protein
MKFKDRLAVIRGQLKTILAQRKLGLPVTKGSITRLVKAVLRVVKP